MITIISVVLLVLFTAGFAYCTYRMKAAADANKRNFIINILQIVFLLSAWKQWENIAINMLGYDNVVVTLVPFAVLGLLATFYIRTSSTDS